MLRSEPVTAFIALGANLPSVVGDAHETLLWAVGQIECLAGVHQLRCSSLYRTAPVDSSGPDYINAVVSISTHIPVYSLLSLLQKIEQSVGRSRPYRNAPRTLDLDVLFYGDAQIFSEPLQVPHPRWHGRAFVLWPLHELAPERVSEAMMQSVADQAIEKISA